MNDAFFLIANLIFWSSLGCTEGYKWTDYPSIVNAKNYHLYRGITNLGFLLSVFFAPFALGGYSLGNAIAKVFFGTMATWWSYEMCLNKVNFGDFFHQKQGFVFGNRVFSHPPVWTVPLVGVVGLVCYVAISLPR